MIWGFYQAAETLTNPSLFPPFCKDPCLRMHFNCIKATRGLLIGPSPSHPPTRLLGWLSASRIVIWQHSLLWKPQPAREREEAVTRAERDSGSLEFSRTMSACRFKIPAWIPAGLLRSSWRALLGSGTVGRWLLTPTQNPSPHAEKHQSSWGLVTTNSAAVQYLVPLLEVPACVSQDGP